MGHPREDPDNPSKNYQETTESSGSSSGRAVLPRNDPEGPEGPSEPLPRADSQAIPLQSAGMEASSQRPIRPDQQSRANSPLNYMGTSAPPSTEQRPGADALPSPIMGISALNDASSRASSTQLLPSALGPRDGIQTTNPERAAGASHSQHHRPPSSGQMQSLSRQYLPSQSVPVMPHPYPQVPYTQYRYPPYTFPPDAALPSAQSDPRISAVRRPSREPPSRSGNWPASHMPHEVQSQPTANIDANFDESREAFQRVSEPRQLQEWYEGDNSQSPESSESGGATYLESGSSTGSETPINEPRGARSVNQRPGASRQGRMTNAAGAARVREDPVGSQGQPAGTRGLSGANDYQEITARFPSLTGYINIPPNGPGQQQPPPRDDERTKTSTMSWEDEGTLCIVVEVNGTAIARRCDNNMINGTKLLNVASMTRGRRDGILKGERIRHVVKIGQMFLKGVWIPFERALEIARRERLVDKLYPLFISDLGVMLYAHKNLSRTRQVVLAAYHKTRDERFRDWINGIPRQRPSPNWLDAAVPGHQADFQSVGGQGLVYDDRQGPPFAGFQGQPSQQPHLQAVSEQSRMPAQVQRSQHPQGHHHQRHMSGSSLHQLPEQHQLQAAHAQEVPPAGRNFYYDHRTIQQPYHGQGVDPRLSRQQTWGQPGPSGSHPYHPSDYNRTGKQQSRRQSRHDPYVRSSGGLHSRNRSSSHIPPMPYAHPGSYAGAPYPIPGHLQATTAGEGAHSGQSLGQISMSDQEDEAADDSEH